jgi:DNA-binding NtrC family response regulator
MGRVRPYDFAAPNSLPNTIRSALPGRFLVCIRAVTMGKPIALLVADNNLLQPLEPPLRRAGLEIVVARRTQLDDVVRRTRPAVTFVVCNADDGRDGLAALHTLRALDPHLPIIVVAERTSEELAVHALQLHATDYFRVPFDPHVVIEAVVHLVPVTRAAAAPPGPALVGSSQAIRDLREYVERIAGSQTSVLITGETGTGKDLVAQLVHHASPRRSKPYVSINCAAIPDSLIESELFGCERGAFTGADAARPGHLAAANGGTVLLDEIGDMTPYAQAKVLRALDTREIYRLGSTRKLPLDIRVVAATNQNLEQLTDEGRFRRDLYYRLNVSRIRLTPLRERPEDIPTLVDHHLAELNQRYGRAVAGFTAEAMQQLLEYEWPGNVREMKNVLEGAFAELPPRPVTFLDAPAAIRRSLQPAGAPSHHERNRLVSALAATNWNVSRAAEHLHWSRMTVYRKLAKYHLTRTRE